MSISTTKFNQKTVALARCVDGNVHVVNCAHDSFKTEKKETAAGRLGLKSELVKN